MKNKNTSQYIGLVWQIIWLLEQSKKQVLRHINTTMITTYWQIGKYIIEYEQWWLDRAQYGAWLIQQLSNDITKQFGKGFSYRSIQRYKQFYLTFPDYASTAGRIEHIWRAHILRIMHLNNVEEQQFFIIETSKEKRSLRELDRQINSALYQRLALSSDKNEVLVLAKKWAIMEEPKDAIKNSYILEFLWLPAYPHYTEKDLESAIISNLQMFLLEIGKWFSFVARQKRIKADIDNYYIDLVFYNRILQCHLLIDLKIGKVTHQDLGQMQMYVNRYDREVRLTTENPTIGLILCREKDDIILKYTLSPEQENIFAKEYQLYLPNKEELQLYLNAHLET